MGHCVDPLSCDISWASASPRAGCGLRFMVSYVRGMQVTLRGFWRDTCPSRNRLRVVENKSAGVCRLIAALRAFVFTAALVGCMYVPSFCFAGDNDINNIAAIGHRNVGCDKGAGNWYSLEKQVAWGKQISRQVESQAKLINEPVISEYVNRVAQNIVRNSDAQVVFTVKVIDSDEVNAFALPGGFFYVNSGLILAADSEAELAGVMAHEIGHVAACHAARENTRANWAEMMSVPLIFAPGPARYGVYEGTGLAVPLTFLSFSREFETQADYLGVQYMYKAGYDPQEFISFFEKLQMQEKKRPGTISKAFATHPQTPDRIAHSQEEIAKILPPRPEYKVTTSEFDTVKARLAALENKRRIIDEKDKKKPGLRQASGNNKNDSDDTSAPLKRRKDDEN
jgi:beta-barrel assembly-enhancing protease